MNSQRARSQQTVVTIGTFDGVHLGHQALLRRAQQLARARGLLSVALTFERPPQNYLGQPKPLLIPPDKKIAILKQFIDHVEVLSFPEVQALTPQEFAARILRSELSAVVVVIGEDFRFGRDRQGDAQALQTLGFDVEVVLSVTVDDEVVSSTAIRRALRQGDIERAHRLLGRPPQLWGRVVRGSGRGRLLGFPTANLAIDPELAVPAEGIYAAWARFDGETRPGALYIGRKPTFGGTQLSVEIYLLENLEEVSRGSTELSEGPLELYGQEMEVQLLARIRGDRRFETIEDLRRQIEADVEAVRALLKSSARGPAPTPAPALERSADDRSRR
jgi:riboflavin kinase/FMN adenylyltransferase